MILRKAFFIGVAASSLLLTSCSGKPSIGDIEDDLTERIASESGGKIELLEIEETNSIDNEVFGQEMYTIQYKAKVKFLSDCYMYVNRSGMGSMFLSFKTYSTSPEFIPSMQMQAVKCSKGDEVEFQGSERYSNTNEGWVKANKVSLF